MQDVPLLPWWFTVGLVVWTAIWPVVGILMGHYLTRSWQRKQWIADNEKEEYRRVLAGLNRLHTIQVEKEAQRPIGPTESTDAMREIAIALNTSLFVRDFFEKSKVATQIIKAIQKFEQGGSFDEYHKEYWSVVSQIIESARKSTL